jgi:hypothetical protein
MPAMMRERVAAYRDARARAARATTARLRREEESCREGAVVEGLDHVALARLTALRDELQSRGERVPPIDGPSLPLDR